jgi:hypothetical protein
MSGPGRKRIVTEEALNTLYDGDNPDSLLNRIPARLVPIFERVKHKLPKTLLSDEKSVRRYVEPDDRDDRVRLAFWDEYNASTAAGKRMSLQSIISGTCSWESWITAYEPHDKRMCWIFTPPTSYVSQMRHILHRGTERLLEIINLPMLTDEGKVDIKVANLILRAWQLADMRVKGGVMQKVQIEQKSMNLNLNAESSVDHLRSQVSAMDLQELESLEARIERAKKDSYKHLRGATKEQLDLIMNAGSGDYEMLEDLENRTLAPHRETLPRLPDFPSLESMEVVTDDKAAAD